MSRTPLEIKQERGHIIRCLRGFYPNGISGKVIFENALLPVFPGLEWRDVSQDLVYLTEAGLVECITEAGIYKAESAKQKLYRLTCAGYDVACGVREDEAVDWIE